MKTKLLLFLAVTLTMIALTSCEKNDSDYVMLYDNQSIPSVKAASGAHITAQFTNGYVFVTIDGGQKFLWGYYMRTFYPEGSAGAIAGTWDLKGPAGCYGFEGNCAPDSDITFGRSPAERNGNSSFPSYVDISEKLADEVNSIYSIPLRKALKEGKEPIKEFFFNNMCKYTEFPEGLIEDFKNDKITVKEFSEGIFIVNTNAEDLKDFPDYNW